jgi:hypothetical protein
MDSIEAIKMSEAIGAIGTAIDRPIARATPGPAQARSSQA